MKALLISADLFEDLELFIPFYRFQEEGIQVDIASLRKQPITGKHGYLARVTMVLDEVLPDDYDVLILPGGKAPEEIRNDPRAIEISRHFFVKNKPVAAICHGPQILISAGLLHGRRATCYHTVAGELKAAGAIYEDTDVVVDGNLVTSRQPSDLPAFMRETLRLIHAASRKSRAA